MIRRGSHELGGIGRDHGQPVVGERQREAEVVRSVLVLRLGDDGQDHGYHQQHHDHQQRAPDGPPPPRAHGAPLVPRLPDARRQRAPERRVVRGSGGQGARARCGGGRGKGQQGGGGGPHKVLRQEGVRGERADFVFVVKQVVRPQALDGIVFVVSEQRLVK